MLDTPDSVIVSALLTAAGLSVSAEEETVLLHDFRTLRDASDALLVAGITDEESDAVFDPSRHYGELDVA